MSLLILVLSFLALFVSFYLLAKIVEGYFIGSLDKIASKLKMSSDAAGATLMAVGSSAPELFVAVFAVFRPGESPGAHAAIGIGNIVGSALFNILAITGAAAFVRKAVIAWQPVVRDLIFYGIAIGLLLLVFNDGNIKLTDALLFIAVYAVYVIVVVFWRKIVKYSDPNEKIIPEEKHEEIHKENHQETQKGTLQKIMRPFDFILEKIFPSPKHYYSVFILSILIIAALSWVLVESAVEIAHVLNISEAIIAVTILAAGTSIPDLLSSVIVSKQGRGGMAISNAVGSNIFDILIGLGLPFLLIIIMTGGEIELNITTIENLERSVQFLLASVFVVFTMFMVNKWKAGKKMGGILILLYLAYIVWVIIYIN